MVVLPWNWAGTGWAMDLARWRYRRGQGWQPHAHAFRELFWIERGRLEHRLGEASEVLESGSLRILRPRDHHVGTALVDGTILMNLSVAEADAAVLERRCGLGLWRGPVLHRLPAGAVTALARLANDCDPRRPADRDLLLLHIDHLVRTPAGPDPSGLPERLRTGLAAMAAAGTWRTGVVGWARHAAVTREHLSRLVRHTVGGTAASFLAEVRLHAAARALVLDDRPVAEVAADLGFVGLGHFAARFRTAFGTTPGAWRRRHRQGGPAGMAMRTPGA